MRSSLPKVLHQLAGQAAARSCHRLRARADPPRSWWFTDMAANGCAPPLQTRPICNGPSRPSSSVPVMRLMQAMPELRSASDQVLVLYGDVPSPARDFARTGRGDPARLRAADRDAGRTRPVTAASCATKADGCSASSNRRTPATRSCRSARSTPASCACRAPRWSRWLGGLSNSNAQRVLPDRRVGDGGRRWSDIQVRQPASALEAEA